MQLPSHDVDRLAILGQIFATKSNVEYVYFNCNRKSNRYTAYPTVILFFGLDCLALEETFWVPILAVLKVELLGVLRMTLKAFKKLTVKVEEAYHLTFVFNIQNRIASSLDFVFSACRHH